MRRLAAMLWIAVAAAACSAQPGRGDGADKQSAAPAAAPGPAPGAGSGAPARAIGVAPAPVTTWFDPSTARAIMAARAEFDAVELAVMSELERRMGMYKDVLLVSRDQYVRHLGGAQVPVPRTEGWRYEQRQRVVYARHILEPALATAHEELARKTLAALSAFFDSELKAERISSADHRRYTADIRRQRFPGVRPRKWSGPAVYEFRMGWGEDTSLEYRKIMNEVRRLWQAQGRRTSAVVWTTTSKAFYQSLVPPAVARASGRASTRPAAPR